MQICQIMNISNTNEQNLHHVLSFLPITVTCLVSLRTLLSVRSICSAKSSIIS